MAGFELRCAFRRSRQQQHTPFRVLIDELFQGAPSDAVRPARHNQRPGKARPAQLSYAQHE
jgi:hypothetical protein